MSMILLFAAGLSCRLEVPIREMAGAKVSISRAVEVKAETYAPQELGKARDYLKSSHVEIEKEKMDEAKSMAVKSGEEAQKAIDKALPLLSSDALAGARKEHGEADLLHAEKYSTESFTASDRLLKEAESLHEGKDYWNSYLKSGECLASAADAKSNSLRYVPTVREEIDRVDSQADGIKAKRGGEFAAAEIAGVKDKLKAAREKVAVNNLKEANPLLDEAKALLGMANESTMRGMSREKLEAAEKTLAQAQASGMKSSFEGDIVKATELVAAGKSLHEAKSYSDSMAKSDEALTLLNTVTVSMTSRDNELKAEAEGKLTRAKTGLEEIQKSDLKARHEAEIGKAAVHVESGNRLYVEKDYGGTIRESDNALAILDVLKAPDKDGGTAGREIKYGIEPATYVVKYNPRDRDCLWKIAMHTYRNARLWPLIYSANKDKIRDPDLIFPGQNLVIPVIPERQKSIREEKVQKGELKDSKSLMDSKDMAPAGK
jgi:nucleoid-associated protein YgaU